MKNKIKFEETGRLLVQEGAILDVLFDGNFCGCISFSKKMGHFFIMLPYGCCDSFFLRAVADKLDELNGKDGGK